MLLGTAPTPTASGLPLRSAVFSTLTEALDYAATGETGFNYYDGRDKLSAVLPYRELRRRALEMSRRLAPRAFLRPISRVKARREGGCAGCWD